MKENKYRDHYCGKLNNNDIEVIALDPHMKEQVEITLKEDIKGFDFD